MSSGGVRDRIIGMPTIILTEGDDRFYGSSSLGDDEIFGLGGDDRIQAGAGEDIVYGGDGSRVVDLRDGRDVRHVWVAGEQLVRDRHLTRRDYHAIRSAYAAGHTTRSADVRAAARAARRRAGWWTPSWCGRP